MISLASSVQTCMRFAGKQRAFPFSSPFPPPPLFFNPLTIFLPFLFLPVQPVTTIRGWFYSILLFRKLTPPLPLFARANERGKKKKEKKSGWPLMDTTRRVNIARVNRLIGQPMAEASLSSSPCIVAHFSRVLVIASPLSSPMRHRICPRKGGLSEERALRGSSFVIVIETPRFFTFFIFSYERGIDKLGEISQGLEEGVI